MEKVFYLFIKIASIHHWWEVLICRLGFFIKAEYVWYIFVVHRHMYIVFIAYGDWGKCKFSHCNISGEQIVVCNVEAEVYVHIIYALAYITYLGFVWNLDLSIFSRFFVLCKKWERVVTCRCWDLETIEWRDIKFFLLSICRQKNIVSWWYAKKLITY